MKRRSPQTPSSPLVSLSHGEGGVIGVGVLGVEALRVEALGVEALSAETLSAEALGVEALGVEALGVEALSIETLGIEGLGRTQPTSGLISQIQIQPIGQTRNQEVGQRPNQRSNQRNLPDFANLRCNRIIDSYFNIRSFFPNPFPIAGGVRISAGPRSPQASPPGAPP